MNLRRRLVSIDSARAVGVIWTFYLLQALAITAFRPPPGFLGMSQTVTMVVMIMVTVILVAALLVLEDRRSIWYALPVVIAALQLFLGVGWGMYFLQTWQ